jgi:putative peptide zinc metalloprotease protein
MQSSSAASLQRSSRRPVPLLGRSDLVVSPVSYGGIVHYVVKDPVGLKYHRLKGEQFRFLELLDGRRTLESLRETLLTEFPAIRPTLRELQRLAAELHQRGLAYSARSGQAETRRRQDREERSRKIRQTLLNVLSLRLPGWDPDAVLQRLVPWFAWMFQPWGVALCLLLVISSWITLALHWSEYRQALPAFEQFFGWPNLVFLWLTLAGAKILHEFGHGIACRYFGSECHEMGVMFLVFSPCLYCDVTDSWMLPNKWQRIIIGGAGMYVELILSALAIFVWQATSAGMLHYLSLNLFFVTAVTTIIFNANPLMRLDGYYMLSDWLEIPNLRPQADRFLRDTFAQVCLGIEPAREAFAPQSGRGWFVAFAVASHIYSWIVLGGILLFLYTVLKPYELQSLGQALAVFSIGSIVGGGIMNLYQAVSAPRSKPLNGVRVAATLTVLAVLLLMTLQIPVPWYRTSACLIEPQGVRHVVTRVPGQIEEVFVQPGDFVREGDLLVRLHDPDWEARLRELQVKIRVQQAEAELYAAADDPSSQVVAREILSGLRAEEAELQEHLRQLKVLAPCSGRVVAAPRHQPSTLEQQAFHLPTWESTPLDPRNRQAFLPERTTLLSIAPSNSPEHPEQFAAVVYLDQADRLDVRERMRLRMKFEHAAWETYTGYIRHIGPAETGIAPAELTNKQGGPLSTVTDKAGQERLTDAAYQAIVEFDAPPANLRTGLRGEARFIVVQRTLGGWIWRWLRRTFDFDL